jgi:bla regulator protein BlaR1
MASLFYNISQVLGITIIHSLWQGLLIYMVLRVVMLSLPQLSSLKKYKLASLALFSTATWFAYAFYTEAQAFDWAPVTGYHTSPLMAAFPQHAAINAGFRSAFYSMLKNYLPYISILYAVGLLINLIKLGIAWNKLRVIKKGMIAADRLQTTVDAFVSRLNIRKRVQVSFSRMVDVPCVIGYFKPILLLPITLTFRLSAEEIETILLHELSHIKSNDYLINLVQQIIAVVLFFNPFAQLINRIISTEREHRCDDMVVETSGSPLTYAYALLKLEEARQKELKLALAATQNKHHLLTRIERIMKTTQPIGNIRHILLAVVLFAGSLSSIAWLNPEIKTTKTVIKNTVHNLYAAVTHTQPTSTTVKVTPSPVSHKTHAVIVLPDTTKDKQIADTTKRKAKIKIVVEDENGNKKEYGSVNDMPESVRNDFLKENHNADFNYNFKYNMDDSARFGEMNKYYNSEKWKKQVEAIQHQAMAMTKKVNTPEFKKHVELMKRQAEIMAKKANSPEWKKMQEDMAKKGEEMAKYYDSPEWKKQVEDLAKAGAEFGTKFVNSPEWKRMQEDLVRSSLEMAKQAKQMARAYGDRSYKYSDNDTSADKEAPKKVLKKKLAEKKEAVKEKAEKAEKKEKSEKPEAPEKPDVIINQ